MDRLDGGALPANRDIVDLQLDDGTVIPVEVTIEPTGDFAPGGRSDASFGDWLSGGRRAPLGRTPTVKGMARWVQSQLEDVDTLLPDRVSLEMGVKFVAKSPDLVTPVLGQVGGEANLLVRLEWDLGRAGAQQTPPPQPESDQDDDRPDADDQHPASGVDG
ncbi:CU044_2847 family protein [Actinoplanes sp. NPDC089786]|uniref:CU044_2847 family protein n=1 Tax=Actinoplanes sp. NPDC089786 TaxID=3155185 RepID=UPI003443F3D4